MRFLSLLLVAVALVAQSPPPAGAKPQAAPPEVDQALRARVTYFFQAHVDGKPRLADKVVAEDSKDIFFEIAKPRYFSFDILKIEYSDNFTKAAVTVNCEQDFMMMGAGAVRMKMPLISHWKLENGQWFWYVDPNATRKTPFGEMKPFSRAPDGTLTRSPLTLPKGPSPEEVQKLVKADKTEVRFNPSEPSTESVVVTNGMPGWVKLVLEEPRVPGLEIKLEHPDLQMGQTARVTLQFQPQETAPPKEALLNVSVEPTGEKIPIRIFFNAPSKP
jgi:hypothetical protein